MANNKLGVEFGSKLITIPEEDKVVKLQCTFHASAPPVSENAVAR